MRGSLLLPLVVAATACHPSGGVAGVPSRAAAQDAGAAGSRASNAPHEQVLLVDAVPGGAGMALDADFVYWLEDSAGVSEPRLRKVGKLSGPAVTVAPLRHVARLWKDVVHLAPARGGVYYATGDVDQCPDEPNAPCPMSLMFLPAGTERPEVVERGDRLRWIGGPDGAWIATPAGYRQAGGTRTLALPPLQLPPGAKGFHKRAWSVDERAVRLLFEVITDRFMDDPSEVFSVTIPVDGGPPVVKRFDVPSSLFTCALAGADAYCTSPRGVLALGSPSTLLAAQEGGRPENALIAVDTESVYWTFYNDHTLAYDRAYAGASPGDFSDQLELFRVPRSGGQRERIAKVGEGLYHSDHEFWPRGLLVDDRYAFVRGSGTLLRIEK